MDSSVVLQRDNAPRLDVTGPLPPVRPSPSRAQNRHGHERLLRHCTCAACGHHVAVPFLDPYEQPLAKLAWPESRSEAEDMPRLPLEFVRCVGCGHVYNIRFDYALVPYTEKPNRMYNKGSGWMRHLERVCDLLQDHVPPGATVVEIGCGEGHLLRSLSARRANARYIGFDPNASMETGGLFEARPQLFEAAVHMAECRPHLVISRHVLEHLVNPLGFLQSLEFAACCLDTPTWVFIEVPCIDRALTTGRTSDFYYEHNSHFTTTSFTRMLHRGAAHVEWIKPSYDGEVICGLARMGSSREAVDFAREAAAFREMAAAGLLMLRQQLAELASSGQRVAIWGGAGKAAAFLNRFGVDADRFPIVVDSDVDKVGTFVPGTGQPIRPVEYLLDSPVEIILIPMQWRARDICAEMARTGISCRQVLIEHEGRLIDFERDAHPY
jgi:hypothetical protein